jgi:hypothetical protein
MKTEDVAYQMMRNDLTRTMKDWLCISKEEMTREAEARSWDGTIDNVCHRMAICDHLLEFKTWRHVDPKPLRGISIATTTRHQRILRKRLEMLMGRSWRWDDPPCQDLPKRQWKLLWQGEETLKKYGTFMWEAGHETVDLFPGASKVPLHTIMRMAGDGIQTHYVQVPHAKRMPAAARDTIQAYLNLWTEDTFRRGAPGGTPKTGPPPRSLSSGERNGMPHPYRRKRWESG